ncbi:MAG: hypothetical protein AUG89_10280 [Acidobacteria bacterium 13_1_20CM_4_56_7]|nr:MAG: hypothetical protein AUG89_10280 [Acidobacteria bacterium 13_1_20CM_4_56_7]
MRDVENSSARIADRYRNEEFSIPPSRLSDIETKGILPSIYRLYTLSVIYRRDVRELMSWYGVDLNNMPADLGLVSPPKSHVSEALSGLQSVQVPVRMDPGFDERRTTNLGRMVEQWGLVPLAYLAQFATTDFTYGYVGTHDFTMYPILPPGSFIQVDESRNRVLEGSWRSEYERPIYFVETRDGHTCCWCSMRREEIILQPHPLSPVAVRNPDVLLEVNPRSAPAIVRHTSPHPSRQRGRKPVSLLRAKARAFLGHPSERPYARF